jgi:hypothetical protein
MVVENMVQVCLVPGLTQLSALIVLMLHAHNFHGCRMLKFIVRNNDFMDMLLAAVAVHIVLLVVWKIRKVFGMESVPYVLGSPMAIPNVFTVRIHAMRILYDKFPQIVDAIEPGGNDMYAGLNDEEKQALTEVTKMGFPPKAWFAYRTMGLHAFPVLYPGVKMADAK